jgi:hypothetical protein
MYSSALFPDAGLYIISLMITSALAAYTGLLGVVIPIATVAIIAKSATLQILFVLTITGMDYIISVSS